MDGLFDANSRSDFVWSCESKRYLMRSDQPGARVFVITKGVVARERVLADGARQIVGLNVSGDVCGLTALGGGYADHDLVALTPVSYLPIGRPSLAVLTRRSAELSRALWCEISREATVAAAWIVNLGQRPAYRRIAYLMCELEARSRAAGIDTRAGIEWPGSQGDLGAALGLSLVHVNKTLRRLEADRLVTSGRKMRFHDIEKLTSIADFDPSYLSLEHKRLGELLLARVDSQETRSAAAYPPIAPDVLAKSEFRVAPTPERRFELGKRQTQGTA